MNTMKWLMKREFWENKGGFFWAPIWVGGIMSFFIAIALFVGLAMGSKHGMHINGVVVSDLSTVVTAQQKAEFADGLATGYMGTAMPLFLVLGFVVFFFCLGSLFDERKDRSVLFWKSLPISDSETVLSKIAMALVVAPLITTVVATITSVILMLLICIAAAISGVNIFGLVLSSPSTYLAPFQIAATIPVYVLWALPAVGWLMMVSAWANTKPFLWAVGVPVLTGTVLSMFNGMFDLNINVGWFWQHIVGRGLLSVAPGSWFFLTDVGNGLHATSHDGADFGSALTQTWQVLATPSLWIGVAVGAAMIYAAMRLRRWKDEG
jgi:ABC-2 type transport system permease protein